MPRRRKAKIVIHMPLVYLEWEDAHANGGWQEKVDHNPALCWSIGYVYQEDRKGITLVGSGSGYVYQEDRKGVTLVGSGSGNSEEAVGNTQYIPKRYIIYRQKLIS